MRLHLESVPMRTDASQKGSVVYPKLPSGKPIEGQDYTCVNPANIDNRTIGDWPLHDLISIFDSMREKITCKFHEIGIYLYLC